MVFLRRFVTVCLLLTGLSASGQARFDLPGPKIDIRVTRAGVMLPITSVPNLLPGDQVWLHPDLPPSQSVHYLLIAAFLRGTTNPPPDNWFIRIETWDKKVREEGVSVTVPEEAQQAILFLAPETGGDFSTLRSAVKGRPGIFVRASQDLAEAGFEQGRIERYLDAMKQVPPGDAKALQEHSDLLARTLSLKPNPDCFKRPLDQQYTCLTQTGSQTLLDDGHAQSIVAALSNGPGSDFINAASYTSLAGAGTYSAYVGAIVDLVRLTSGLHTAKYQYIPAIAYPAQDSDTPTLDLRLNTPPSFNNPKSVIVIGLPAVQKTIPPPLRPVDLNHISCLLDPRLTLPIEGAPLVFATSFAHDLVLHLDLPPGAARNTPTDIPLVPDAYQGGLVLRTSVAERHELTPVPPAAAVPVPVLGSSKPPAAKPSAAKAVAAPPGAPITGTIEGMWGFDHFSGPTLPLQQVPGTGWRLLSASDPATSGIIVGQPNHLRLISTGTACVKSITLEPVDAKVEWKLDAPPATSGKAAADVSATPHEDARAMPPPPQPVEVTLNLQHDAAAGSVHLAIEQFGASKPDLIGTRTFLEPAKIDALQMHAGDTMATLTGNSLDQVTSLSFSAAGRDFSYSPQASAPSAKGAGKTLTLALAGDGKPPALKPTEKVSAEVHLRDGRTLHVSTMVLGPRPEVSILSRRVSPGTPSPIALTSGDDLSLGSQLTFFLKSRTSFSRTDKVEIAAETQPEDAPEAGAADPSLATTLSISAGSLVLQDAHTILATFDPLKTFGPSTFGPFHLRAIASDGTAGEWVPLATIVRLPTLTSLTCPADPAANCLLAGSALYLIDSISLDAAFTAPTKVPEGFVENVLPFPHPRPGRSPATFYLRLRDDPAKAQQVTLNVQSDTPPLPRGRGSRSQATAASAKPAPVATDAAVASPLPTTTPAASNAAPVATPATPAATTPPPQ